MKKNAFTLAEVLITLGIIGVIAALTIPNLIANHKKQVVISRLKKAISTIGQANQFAQAKYGTTERENFQANNPDDAIEQFNKYYTPFINISRVEKGTKGAFGYLHDGTAFYFRKTAATPETTPWANTYLFLCINHKVCENYDENDLFYHQGKDVFTLYASGKVPAYIFKFADRNRIISGCADKRDIEACSALIFLDGWQIKDDYPIKL